jgi:hypothetical protein
MRPAGARLDKGEAANPDNPSCIGDLTLHFWQSEYRRLWPAADAVPLPELKPWTMGQGFIMPSIGSRDIACAEWPDIRSFEHLL